MQEYTDDWMKWRSLVDRVLGDPLACPLISRLPQLMPLLETMAGRVPVIEQLSVKYGAEFSREGLSRSPSASSSPFCWRTHSLCSLLYGGPPVTSSALSDVLQTAMDKHRDTAP